MKRHSPMAAIAFKRMAQGRAARRHVQRDKRRKPEKPYAVMVIRWSDTREERFPLSKAQMQATLAYIDHPKAEGKARL